MSWVNVKDELPDCSIKVSIDLWTNNGETSQRVANCFYRSDEQAFCQWDCGCVIEIPYYHITHWMYGPKPPQD